MILFLEVLISYLIYIISIDAELRTYIDCSPDSQSTTVIYKNEALYKCENGSLLLKYCIFHKFDILFTLNANVLKNETNNQLSSNEVNCSAVDPTLPDVISQGSQLFYNAFPDPMHDVFFCADDEDNKNTIIISEDETSVYVCVGQTLRLDRCMFKANNSYKCVSKSNIMKRLESKLDHPDKELCQTFLSHKERYIDDATTCSTIEVTNNMTQGLKYYEYSFNTGEKGYDVMANPQFINCCLPAYDKSIVVYDNLTWHQCINGKLTTKYCISTVLNNGYLCTSRQFRRTNENETTLDHSDLSGVENFTDCKNNLVENPLVDNNNSVLPENCCLKYEEFVQEKASTDENSTIQRPAEICSIDEPIYYIESHNFHECNGQQFELSRCIVHRNGVFKCVPKEDARRIIQKLGWHYANDTYLCGQFLNVAKEILWNEQELHLLDCNDGISDSLASLDEESKWPPLDIQVVIDPGNTYTIQMLQYVMQTIFNSTKDVWNPTKVTSGNELSHDYYDHEEEKENKTYTFTKYESDTTDYASMNEMEGSDYEDYEDYDDESDFESFDRRVLNDKILP